MAKPDGYNDLTLDTKIKIGHNLITSTRGNLLLGQALAHAMKAMSHDENPETSNIEDMEMMAILFRPFFERYMSNADLAMVYARIEGAYNNAK